MKKLGKWELIKKLGSGAFAEVWLAAGPNRKDAPLVALKLVHAHLAGDPQFRVLLQEEAWAASLLSHPNVVEIYEVAVSQGRPYLAMEFIPGQSLYALLRKLSEKGDKLSVGEATYAVNQAALGLHYAHDVVGPDGAALGLVHRDVSPHNLIAADDGRVKVVDFGLAKVASGQNAQNEQMEGKIAYMPPEQIHGERVDRRVDTYALGACLWELLSGQKMYQGVGTPELLNQALRQPPPDARLVFSHLRPELADVVAKAVAREKQARFQTALELAEALEPFISDDAAEKLGRRLSTHFDFMPRTKEEAVGIDKPAGPRRRTSLSASPRATTSVPKATSKPKGASGSKKRASASVTQEPAPKGRRGLALFAIIVLPLIALGVLLGSVLAAKFITPVDLVSPAAPQETVEPALPAEPDDAGAAPATGKKPVKRKARDAGI